MRGLRPLTPSTAPAACVGFAARPASTPHRMNRGSTEPALDSLFEDADYPTAEKALDAPAAFLESSGVIGVC